MLPCLDNTKLFSLGVGMFGVISVYLIYNVIYERAIYQHFAHSQTNQKQIFESEVGFAFLEQFFAWVIVEVIVLSLKKQQQTTIPRKYSFVCGLFCSISSLLFTFGTFEISYISCLLHKTFAFGLINFFSFMFGKFFIKHNRSKRIDIVISKFILCGNLIFWIYAEQQWFFSQNKNGHLYAHTIVLSGFFDAFLSIAQTSICQNYQPAQIQLLHAVSRWTVLCSLVVLTLKGELFYTVSFLFTHYDFAVTMISLAGLYFIGQFFLYRITTKMVVNAPLFISTSKNTFMAQQSYSLSRHKVSSNQVIGMVVSWVAILVQFILLCRKDQKEELQSPFETRIDQQLDEFQTRILRTKRK